MKKFISVVATILAAGMAASLAGCTGCAGCSGSVKTLALTNSNWFTGTSYKGIQPSFIVSDEHPEYTKEIITYEVTHAKPSVGNTTYSAEYKDGSFRTEFYATKYDWNGENIPVEFKADKTEILYCYKTELNISVQFTLSSGESSDWFADKMVSECYFRSAGDNLQPVYSRQSVKSTSPAKLQATSLNDAYTQVEAEYVNFYNYDCTKVISYAKENGNTSNPVHNLSKVKTSLFDNSSLYIAVRSLKLSETLSQSISLYSAAAGGVSLYQISGKNTALEEDELTSISAVLEEKGLYIPKEESAEEGKDSEAVKGVPTVAVSVVYNGGDLQGTTQTIWYAAIENADNNIGRATMLKIAVPLSYGLGTLNYTLKDIESTLWNG